MLWRAVCVMTGHVCRKSCRSAERIGKVVQSEVSRQTRIADWSRRLRQDAFSETDARYCGLRFAAAGFQTLVSNPQHRKESGEFYGISMCRCGYRKVPMYLNGSRAVLYLPNVPGRRVCLRRKLRGSCPYTTWLQQGGCAQEAPRVYKASILAVREYAPHLSVVTLSVPRGLAQRCRTLGTYIIVESLGWQIPLCPAQHLCGRHCIPYYPCCCVNGGSLHQQALHQLIYNLLLSKLIQI